MKLKLSSTPSGQKYLMFWMCTLTIILFDYLFEHICKSSKYKIIKISSNRDLYILKLLVVKFFHEFDRILSKIDQLKYFFK